MPMLISSASGSISSGACLAQSRDSQVDLLGWDPGISERTDDPGEHLAGARVDPAPKRSHVRAAARVPEEHLPRV